MRLHFSYCAVFVAVTVLCSLLLGLPAAAEHTLPAAQQLSAAVIPSAGSVATITDGKTSTYLSIPAGGSITISADTQIAGIYVLFDRLPATWQCASEDGRSMVCGTYGFLHEYVDVSAGVGAARSLTLSFPAGASVADLSVWSAGTLPEHVQRWEPPHEKADLLLFSTHSDDEHLFFAGILPHCIDRGLAAQVVYLTGHTDTHNRPHEQIDGLWAVGVRHYPIVGPYPDLYSTSLQVARTLFANYGYSEDSFVAYAAEQIRRFRPQVVVGHDVNGEYNHGAHMVNTAALRAALEVTADPTAYPDSAAAWGTWDVPKTYLHLWAERPVTMNWDIPLDSYGGMTAYEVSCLGYDKHVSQHWTWFTRWLRGTTADPITAASQITTYSPCAFGLYRTTVGDDTPGVNDFFEHITPYAEQTTAPPETTAVPETTSAPETTLPRTNAPEPTTAPDTTRPPAGEAGGFSAKQVVPLVIGGVMLIAVCALLGPVGRSPFRVDRNGRRRPRR